MKFNLFNIYYLNLLEHMISEVNSSWHGILFGLKNLYNKIVNYIQYFFNIFVKYIWEYIYQYLSIIILIGFISLKKGTNIIFLNSVTNDSIFSAIDFICSQINGNKYVDKYVKPFIVNMNLKFDMSIIDRYIYYLLINIMLYTLNILFWGYYSIIIYYLLIVTTHPYVLRLIIAKTFINNIITFFQNKINKMTKHITLSLYSYCFNNICISIVKKNPKICADELDGFYKNKSYSHLIDFLKIFLISVLIQYMESIGSVYTRLVKILYNYGALIEIKSEYTENDPYHSILDPKEKIIKIIERRNWELFFNPKILKLIIKLYRENDGESILDNIKNKIKYIEIIIGKFFAFYSISALLDSPYASLLISTILCYCNKQSIKYYIPKLLSLLLWYYNYNLITVTIISELSELIYNKVSKYISDIIYKKIREQRYLLIHENKYNLEIIVTSLISYNIWNQCYLINILTNGEKYNFTSSFSSTELLSFYKIILISLICMISKNKLISLYIFIFGVFSSYNSVHLLLNSIILYLGINIYNFKTVSKQKVKLNIINSYVTEKITLKNSIEEKGELKDNINLNIVDSYLTKLDLQDDLTNNEFLNNGIIIPKNGSLIESSKTYKNLKKKNRKI